MVQEKLGQTGEAEEDSEDGPDRVESNESIDETDVERADSEDSREKSDSDPMGDERGNVPDSDAPRKKECLSLRARGIELPDEPGERSAIFNRLREVIEETLAEEYGIESQTITGRLGHEYAQIPVICPNCEGPLNMGEMFSGDTNEAYALVECENCSYTGGVTFRAIDLKNDNEDGPNQSAVRTGGLTPTYVGYGG